MMQPVTAATLASFAISGFSVCATPPPKEAASADTAFVLMGTSEEGLSRRGAGESAFKGDARHCLDHSADTRATTGPDAEAGARFPTFAACMHDRGWRAPAEGAPTQLVRPYETVERWHGSAL